MMNPSVPFEKALKIAQRRCAAADVELVLPSDPRRDVVVTLVNLAHKIQKTGVKPDHVAQSVTMTLPGVPGPALGLIALIPHVGIALAGFAAANGRTAIYLSPAAMADAVQLLATVEHELGHAGMIAVGGLPFCIAYLLAAEARGATEAPCYGAGMVVLVGLGGMHPDEAEANALRSIEHYGLDREALILARAMIQDAAETIRSTGDFGGILAELYRELAEENIVLLG